MANQEHLDVPKQGVEVWNRWRKEYSSVQPDLSEVDFRYADLTEVDFSLAHLAGANPHEAV